MSNTKIEWTDKCWNPITGCAPISEGCYYCYAKRFAQRFKGRFGYPEDDPFRVTFHPDRLDLPLHWRKPSRIFVNSMGDLFHHDVRPIHIGKVFGVIASCKQHVFQVLTKRPKTMWSLLDETITGPVKGEATQIAYEISQERFARDFHLDFPLPNLWLGVTVESADYKGRINILRRIPAAVRFISFEPLLGDVGELDLTGIHWVIVGGETGSSPRPMAAVWVLNIEKQCDKQHIPFFFKKWGRAFKENPCISTGRRREFPQTR